MSWQNRYDYNKDKQFKASNRLEYRKTHKKKWNAVVEYARKNWAELQYHASFEGGNVSIADQLEMYCDVPHFIAQDVANTIALMKQTIER